jgi:cell division protein FtsI/penicillin-binding protein 2
VRRLSLPVLFGLIVAAGVFLLGRQLATLYQEPAATIAEPARFPPALAGERFGVPADAGFHRIALTGGTLLVEGPHRSVGQARVSLCDQRARSDPNSPLIPLYIGWDWTRIREAIDANLASVPPRPASFGLKNPLLDDGPGGADAPAVVLDTQPPGAPLPAFNAPESRLRLTLRDSRPLAGLSDTAPDFSHGMASTLSFRQDAWLLWDAGAAPGRWRQALRVQRLPGAGCPFGYLQVTVYGPPDDTVPAPAARRLRFYPPQGPVLAFALAPGDYAVPAGPPPAQEDADLFAAATTAGLIRPDADGRIAVAPADLRRRLRFARDYPEWLVAESGDSWLTLPWDAAAEDAHRLLYGSAPGRYLRQQIDAFNARRLLAAVRLRAEDADRPVGAGPWQVDRQGVHLPLIGAMPLLAGGLFAELPQHWDPWQRVERWPAGADAATPVRFTLPLAARPTGQRLQLLAVGREIRVEGAAILSAEPRCLAASPCEGAAVLARELRVQVPPNAAQLAVQLRPLPAQAAPALFRHDFTHIHLEEGQLRWQALTPAARQQRGDQRARVTLRARDGALLWDNAGPTEAAWTLGLGALVGLHPRHDTAVAGILARLWERGTDSADARLTLDSTLQRLARTALLAQLPAVAARFGARDPYRTQRFASLVVLDADRGDILAAVSLPEPPRDAAWSDLSRFNAAQPRRGPLRWWAWQHDGGHLHVPGSTFKLVSALALERSARERPELDALLDGLAPDAIARHPLASRHDFGVQDACYPAREPRCQRSRYAPAQQRASGGVIHNFASGGHYATLANQVNAGDRRYGLVQALRDSLNTWFAWLVETSDATLLDDPQAAGLPHARALTPAALDRVRPLAAVTAALGFSAEARLDGGLLPADVPRAGDVLLATASRLDPIQSRHQVRLAALGFRMQVTPLQMARVAASIATDQRVVPRLLLELNGRTAGEPAFAPLGIPTQRIRQGLKRVPEDGTAQQAFKDRRFAVLRPALYAKTGTADLSREGDINNAWLAGWVEPGGIPGEKRRLAFACLISHSREVGGRECGAVVAGFLAALAETGKRAE